MSAYNVLVVEDSPTMRQLIVFALNRIKGLNIVEANNGVDGLKKLSNKKFDLILTDVNMPIMDGLKLVNLVRKDPNYQKIPIVIITTEGSEEDRGRALELGVDDYLTKPLQTSRVLEVTKRLLKIYKG